MKRSCSREAEPQREPLDSTVAQLRGGSQLTSLSGARGRTWGWGHQRRGRRVCSGLGKLLPLEVDGPLREAVQYLDLLCSRRYTPASKHNSDLARQSCSTPFLSGLAYTCSNSFPGKIFFGINEEQLVSILGTPILSVFLLLNIQTYQI